MTAVRAALRRAIPGDLVVCCVDDAIAVYREAMAAAGHVARRDGVRRSGRADRAPGGLTGSRSAHVVARDAVSGRRGSSGCAGSTCCSRTGRSRSRRCGRSSRRRWRSTRSRAQAWLGVVPFRMEDVAPRFLPAPPGPGAFPELNVRTYVTPRRPRRGLVPEPRRREPARGRGRAGRVPPAVLPGTHVGRDRRPDAIEYRSRTRRRARSAGRASTCATGRPARSRWRRPGRWRRSSPTGCGCSPRTPTAGSHGRRSGTHPGRSSRPRPRFRADDAWPRPTA